MDKEWMRRLLPELPPAGYEEWVEIQGEPDLNVDLMLFSAERAKVYPPLQEIEGPSERKPIKTIWQSRCICTVCGEDFVTQYVNNGAKGFLMYQGEDGCLYPVDPAGSGEPETENEIEDYGYDGQYIELSDGDNVVCPNCFTHVDVMHRSKIKGGRTKQTLGCTVQNIWNYTAVIYWLTAKHIDEDGTYWLKTYPRDAYVIGERGGITRYRHTGGAAAGFTAEYRLDHWKAVSDVGDESAVLPYHSWQSINNLSVGHWTWNRVPDLEGCSGEKTGLDDYIRQGGHYPVTYLKIWQKHRNVENLVRAGWAKLIEQNITRYTNYDPRNLSTGITGVDWSKKKPHEMLKMKKPEFKALTQSIQIWDMDIYNEWAEYHDSGGSCSALEFEKYYKSFRSVGIAALMTLREDDDQLDLPKLAAYLDKQGIEHDDAYLLVDARRMAEELHPDDPLSRVELWPRRLRAVHDELSRLQAIHASAEKSRELDAGFEKIREMFGCLEWGDGDLRIMLPRRNEDLIVEGHKLNHCVGRYGTGHVAGNGVIFFVRKYRRPERSYYTLDICMTESVPREVQLHGYGNERHGPNNQYTHKIPKRVRDFVDRWKKEVLMPWWLSKVQSDIKEKSA